MKRVILGAAISALLAGGGLASANGINSPVVQPQIDGQLLGAPVVPAGAFGDGNPADQWQQFTFSWNSGSNSSASLILHDFTGTSEGNDFGLDNIQVAGTPSTPLPASLLPGSAGILAVLLYGWRRSQLA